MKLPASLIGRLSHYVRSRVMSRAPNFVIGKPGDDYLRRWFIIPRNAVFNIYAHQFIRSDDDRALHDHPWWNASILLDGEYVEHTIPAGGVNQRKLYKAGDVKLRSSRYAHRVELVSGPCISLFITGPRLREWGFHCPAGWKHWRDFTAAHNSGEIGPGCDDGSASRSPMIATRSPDALRSPETKSGSPA